jgi:hypothetical protein
MSCLLSFSFMLQGTPVTDPVFEKRGIGEDAQGSGASVEYFDSRFFIQAQSVQLDC